MIDQLKTIREFIESVHEGEWAPYAGRYEALTALTQIEADHYSAADMASAAAQGFRDGVASVAQQPSKAKLEKLREWETSGELIDRAWSVLQSQEQEIMRLEKTLAEERAQQPQAEAMPVAVLRRGEDGAFSVSVGDYLLAVYALPPGNHRLFTRPQQVEAVQYTRADLDRAYSAGLVEGERLAIQQAEAVPPGYVLVPVQPTPEMVREGASAARSYMQETGGNSFSVIYRAMINAAIAQQKGQP